MNSGKNDTWKKKKKNVKMRLRESRETDQSRLFQIKEMTKGGKDLDIGCLYELMRLTEHSGGNLSPSFVREELNKMENNILLYGRKSGIPSDEKNPGSGFSIYTMEPDEENKKIVLHIQCIVGKDSKNVIQNVLQNSDIDTAKNYFIRGCAETAISDLEDLLREIIKESATSGKYHKGELILESLNIEYVVKFYVKQGFFPDKNRFDDQLIPMIKFVELESRGGGGWPQKNTSSFKKEIEDIESSMNQYRPRRPRRLVGQGVNSQGNNWFTYSDGGFSYMNMDSEGRFQSAYHEGHEGSSEYGKIPQEKRKKFANSLPRKRQKFDGGSEERKTEGDNSSESDSDCGFGKRSMPLDKICDEKN